MTPDDLSELKLNPLEVSAPDRPPDRWHGPWVEKCLVDGFETLRAMPSRFGPATFATAWPVFRSEDEFALEVQRLGIELPAWAMPLPRPERPTKADLTAMEQVIGWPGAYLGASLALRLAVLRVTFAKALGKADGAGWVHKRFGGPSAEVWQGRCWAGCQRIAWGLERDRVAVF